LLLLMLPVTALAFTIFNQPQTAKIAQAFTATSTENGIQVTLDALEASIAGQSEDHPGEGSVETAVAATMAALQTEQPTTAAFGALEILKTTGTITESPHTDTPVPDSTPPSTPTGGSSPLPSPSEPIGAATSTSNPVVSPTSSQTAAPSATDTSEPPTPTSTIPPTPTTAPTATTPPTDPCDGLSLGGFSRNGKTVVWILNNGGSTAQTLTSIRLTWPLDNQSLFKVDLGGSTIWVGDESASPVTIGSWIGGDTSRTFSGERVIQFRFKGEAVEGDYGLVVNFASGCSVNR
jgi:hypothetical protein